MRCHSFEICRCRREFFFFKKTAGLIVWLLFEVFLRIGAALLDVISTCWPEPRKLIHAGRFAAAATFSWALQLDLRCSRSPSAASVLHTRCTVQMTHFNSAVFFFFASLQHFKGLFEGQVQVYRLTSEVGLGQG